jgi:hypothetical protein
MDMVDNNRDSQGDIPTDEELAAADAANEGSKSKRGDPSEEVADSVPNPPRTTTGKWFTTPKFGSAGSGGLEIEPGLDKD